jgi:hypothetical protein
MRSRGSSGAVRAFVLGGHPGLRRLLDQLLADRMHAGIELGDGAGAGRPVLGLVGQLGPQLLEGLHVSRVVLACPAVSVASKVTS